MFTGEVHNSVSVTKPSMNIQIKEPKPFNGEKQDAKSWVKEVKRYFIAAGLSKQDDVHNAQMNKITQDLMPGKDSKWLEHLE